MSTSTTQFTPSIRLGEHELKRVFEKLARRAERASEPINSSREKPRIQHQRPSIPVAIRTTEESEYVAYTTPMLDLSETGVGLLFGRFVHPGSECRMALRTTDRELRIVEGRVMWCDYLKGALHRVGVRFDEPIDLADYSLNYAMARAREEAEAGADQHITDDQNNTQAA